MKKTYFCPMTSVHFVQMEQQLMAGSVKSTNIDDLGVGGGTEGSGIVEGNARRYSVWGDDEEEDF